MHGLPETGIEVTGHVLVILLFVLTLPLALAAQPIEARPPQFDMAAVERGKAAFVVSCGFCHGTNARGGDDGGPDLVRSVLVIDDDGGKELGEFLKVGRPDKGMQAFPNLTRDQVADIATFLHQQIYAAATRRDYKILDILVGDAKAGEAYFNGAGKCTTCHSVTGDLKGVGEKYDPVTLQGRIVMPRGGRGPGPPPGTPPAIQRSTTIVTVTLPSGQSYSGALVRVTDFDVTLREASGTLRSFTRNDDAPKVEVNDPLQGHIDLLSKYKDSDIHNLTSYLVTLK